MSGRRTYVTADVIKMYMDRVGDHLGWLPGLGPATEDDVRTAVENVGATVEPWSLLTAKKLDQALEGVVRQRRPRYHVERIPVANRTALALIHDPEGMQDNRLAAWDLFLRLADDEAGRTLINAQWDIRRAGGTVEEVARRRGVSERTIQSRRRGLKEIGADPDRRSRRVTDDD